MTASNHSAQTLNHNFESGQGEFAATTFYNSLQFRFIVGLCAGFLSFGLLIGLYYVQTNRITDDLRIAEEWAEPLVVSAAEMEINVAEVHGNTLAYVNTLNPDYLQKVEGDLDDLAGYLEIFKKLADTDETAGYRELAITGVDRFNSLVQSLLEVAQAILVLNIDMQSSLDDVEQSVDAFEMKIDRLGSDHSEIQAKLKKVIVSINPLMIASKFNIASRDTFIDENIKVLMTELHQLIEQDASKHKQLHKNLTDDWQNLYHDLRALLDVAKRYRLLTDDRSELTAKLSLESLQLDNLLDDEIQSYADATLNGLRSDINRTLNQIGLAILFSAIVGVCIGIATVWWSSQLILRPLSKLASAARSAARGDFYEVPLANQTREFLDMTVAFNEMTAARQRAESELVKLNETLELQVSERTAELVDVNSSLLKEIEERERLTRQIIEVQKMDALGQLTGGIAHDFNNLLGIIIGNLDLIKERFTTNRMDGVEDMLSSALNSALSGTEFIKQLMSFGRRQPLENRLVDLNATLDASSPLMKKAAGETCYFNFNLCEEPSPVVIDSVQFESAMINLCANARDAMPDGGTIFIKTDQVHVDDNFTEIEQSDNSHPVAVVIVKDNGQGIKAENLPHLFEPFFSTKEVGKGTGLGLASVWGFVKQSGGHIECISNEGQGTEFRIYLPLADTEAISEDEAGDGSDGGKWCKGNGEMILVVEDNASLRTSTGAQLRELGYEVIETSNATQAQIVLESQLKVDLVFTDIVMPGVQDGLSMAYMIMDRWPNIAVLMTTGFSSQIHNDSKRIPKDDGLVILRKPYRMWDLAKHVRAAIDKEHG